MHRLNEGLVVKPTELKCWSGRRLVSQYVKPKVEQQPHILLLVHVPCCVQHGTPIDSIKAHRNKTQRGILHLPEA